MKIDTIDLIILDIMMPKITGIELLKKLREFETGKNLKASKIIMATALNSSGHKKEAFFEGSDDYIVKPITRTSVFEMMKNMGFVTERKI